MIRARAFVLGAVVLGTIAPSIVRAHIGSHTVTIRNNFFDPDRLAVDPGETVTWSALDGGHSVTADEGAFDFPASGGTLSQGETVAWTAPDDDVAVVYRCRVHAGMAGVIVVGDPPPPPPPPPSPVEVRAVPSEAYPTIARALRDPPARLRVEIAPGSYGEAIVVPAPGAPEGTDISIELAGTGDDPSAVTLEGTGTRNTGIAILSPGVHLRNLTVRSYTSTAILVREADDWSIDDVVVTDTPFGVRAAGATGGRIRAVTVSGASATGISLEACDPCDIDVDRAQVTGSLAGLVATDAGSIVVRRSTFAGNGAGIVLRGGAGTRGAHLWRNTITANTVLHAPPAAPGSALAVGAGIWISSGSYDRIEENLITGHRYGIAITGPSIEDRVTANIVGDSTEADLAWDGIGRDVCFAANEAPDGAAPTFEPSFGATLYDCSMPGAGVPYPLILAKLELGARGEP